MSLTINYKNIPNQRTSNFPNNYNFKNNEILSVLKSSFQNIGSTSILFALTKCEFFRGVKKHSVRSKSLFKDETKVHSQDKVLLNWGSKKFDWRKVI